MSPDPTGRALAAVRAVPDQCLIGGVLRDATGGGRLAVENPATGEAIAEVADATPVDAVAAMDCAEAAQDLWAATSPRDRADLLHRIHAGVISAEADLAAIMTLEMGKSLEESIGEVRYAAEFLRWFAEEAVRIDGWTAVAPRGEARLVTLRQPVGVCVLVTPWNFPLAMAARKVAPAFAAGCTCVVKPAQQTPLTMLAFAQIVEAAGAPPGALNVLTTSRSGPLVAAMLDHPAARKLSFTGSTEVGRQLAEHAGRRLLRTSMELGGNNPFLVFEDADLEAAVEGAMLAKMRNIGQACTAANRFLVHHSLATEFTERLAGRMSALPIGPGLSGAQVGPLIDSRARANVASLVHDAVARGARVVTGGGSLSGPGYFFSPTVLADTPADARMVSEEIFGPVAAVQTFGSEAEAIAMANDTVAGLTAYAYTRDSERSWRLLEQLDVGMVGFNRGLVSNAAAPFGGVKDSGMGREGGPEGIDEYLQVKYASIAR